MFVFLMALMYSSGASATESLSENRIASPTPHESYYEWIPTVGLSVFSASGAGAQVSDTEGFVGGLLVDFRTGINSLKFETGALYLQEGDSIERSNSTLTNNYLLLPLLARVRLATINVMALHVRGGLAPAFLMSATSSQGGLGVTSDVKSQTREFDVQAILSAGLSYEISRQYSLTGDLAYTRGLLSFLKSGNPTYNEGFMLTGGVIF